MKAYKLARLLYPHLGKQDIIDIACPDTLLICKKITTCDKDKLGNHNDCTGCWEMEVSQKRVDWLIESAKMCEMMGCSDW